MPGITRNERTHQRFGGAHFTHRHGVQPDHRPPGLRLVPAEALGDVLAVARLTPAAPPQVHEHPGKQQPEQQPIAEAPDHAGSPPATSLNAVNTSATSGAIRVPPRLRTCAPWAAYTPVSPGCVPQ